MKDDDPELARAARAIAAGDAADWAMLESSVGDESRPILDELRVIGAISAFHQQSLEPGGPSAPPSSETAPSAAINPSSRQRLAPTDSSALLSQPASAAAEPNTIGHWGALTLVEEIGHGSFSRVYRARDPKIDREVALRLLDRPSAAEAPAGGFAVGEEGRLLARVRHPNVVIIHGADAIDGRVGIEMELIAWHTLDEIVRVQGPMGPDEAMLVARSVCRALAAVHRVGLVHRDVKAANVMREQGGRIVLMDHGAGSDVAEGREGSLVGTPLYLAPEVLAGSAATNRADIYSLGVLLFHLTTATYPCVARSVEELRSAHAAGRRTRLRDHRPDLPERFIQVVERALAPDPTDRFQIAGDFEGALSESLERPDQRTAASSGRIAWKPAFAGGATPGAAPSPRNPAAVTEA
jgi:serine/threonine protein kinase